MPTRIKIILLLFKIGSLYTEIFEQYSKSFLSAVLKKPRYIPYFPKHIFPSKDVLSTARQLPQLNYVSLFKLSFIQFAHFFSAIFSGTSV